MGCDGAHSKVRELLGLTFTGGLGKFPQLFMLADVDVDWDMPEGHLLRFMHETDGRMDNMLVCVPLRGRVPVPDRDHGAAPVLRADRREGRPAGVQRGTRRTDPGRRPGRAGPAGPARHRASNLRWSSVFRISHGIVDRYGDGRVFVAGDAAHLHPPAGGQGMNTGIQDAWNLAWKLALAVRGLAAPGLLDSYETERRPEGEEIVGRAVADGLHRRTGPQDDRAQFLPRDVHAAQLREQPDGRRVPSARDGCAGPQARRPRARRRRPAPAGVGHPLRLHDLTRGTRHTLLIYADAHRRGGGGERRGEAGAPTCAGPAEGTVNPYLLSPGRAGAGAASIRRWCATPKAGSAPPTARAPARPCTWSAPTGTSDSAARP